MARYNEILVGRYARAVQKLFGIKGEVPVASLAGELGIVHQVFNGAENRYLEGWERFGVSGSQAAGGVGTRVGVRFRNPVGSNLMAVFEKLLFFSPVAGPADVPIITVDPIAVDLPASQGAVRFDARGRGHPTLIGSSGTGTISANEVFQSGMLGGSFVEVITTDIHEIPLLPGDALTMWAGTLNQAVLITAWWRERFLEESERA